MALSFRTARKMWMGVVALLSLVCILLSVILWLHGYSKFNNFGALVAIPCFAFIGAIWSIFRKTLFSPQIVCVEATWVFTLLRFQILLGFFAFESDGALWSRFTEVYQALVALVWINVALGIPLEYQPINALKVSQILVYAAGIIFLVLLTQFSCDQGIWTRDIDSSPCPFPFPILLVHAFPFTAEYFRGIIESRDGALSATSNYCLPSCPCSTKPTETPVPSVQNANHIGGTQSSIPIRVPTVMERQNTVHVTLGHMA